MGAIELRDVTVAHAGHTVLEHVDLVVGDGEVVALLGRSGSGKTSLLRVVAGHDRVAGGQIIADGRDVTRARPRDRRIGMVAQGAPLQPNRDVEGNLRLPFDLRGEDRERGRERALGEALRFGLQRLLGRRPNELSEGQRAATALARSVVSGPTALLLDEPAAQLDHITRARVLQQIGIVQRTRGTTILLATNQLGVASSLAHRVAVLDRGTVAQVAPLPTLRADPLTLDVADLVHASPLSRVTGVVEPGTGGRATEVRTTAGPVRTWHRHVRDHGGPVTVAVAQHDVRLVAPGDGDLTGVIGRIVGTGAYQLVTVDTAAGPVTAAVDSDEGVPVVGTTVGMALDRALLATAAGDVLAVVDHT